MRKLYGDSLRKEAGFVKVIKNVASKNARILESRAGRHAPEIRRVAQEVKGTFDKVFDETAEVVEEFLTRCEFERSTRVHPLTARLMIFSEAESEGIGSSTRYKDFTAAVERTTGYYVSGMLCPALSVL